MSAAAHPLETLYRVIAARRDADPGHSYTARLLAGGTPAVARKVGEEAVETVVEALAGSRDGLAAESADLLYHLLVLWTAAGLEPDEVWKILEDRSGVSGLEEKARRSGS